MKISVRLMNKQPARQTNRNQTELEMKEKLSQMAQKYKGWKILL